MNDQILNIEIAGVKPCRKCGGTDKYRSGHCKPCTKSRVINNYVKNRDAKLAYAKNRYQEKRNDILAYTKQWHIKNAERRLAYAKKYSAENIEKVKNTKSKCYTKNRQKYLEVQKAWRASNPDKVKDINLRARHVRRASKNANGGNLSKNIVERLMALQNGKCACCGVKLNGSYELDHIMPIALGGSNSDDNVQLLRVSCNRKKGAKHPLDWAREQGRLL